ncbi:MAG: manganese efflux pump MntP family protein [Acutalibacteraceae bacterium]
MGIIELFLVAIGLSMDAFAVSICKGLALKNVRLSHSVKAGLWFGGFQALMPIIGFFCGYWFKDYISAFDHWIAFMLLLLLGAKMIKEALSDEEESTEAAMDVKNMLLLAIATSIDALAVGITFAFLNVNIWYAVAFIGVITFLFSAVGIKIGSLFGTKFKTKAEIAGGVILILMGAKILLEHLGVIAF